MLTRLVVTLTVAALFLALPVKPAQSKPLEDYDWVEVATDDFRIRSIRSERTTLGYARELALLVKVVPTELKTLRRKDAEPVTFYVLRNSGQAEELFREEKPWYSRDVWFFEAEEEQSLVVGGFSKPRGSIAYVYARYLFGGGGKDAPLHWWQEGLTEYFRYAGIDDGDYYFGSSAAKRVESPEAVRVGLDLITTPATDHQLTPDDRGTYRYYAYRLTRFLTENSRSWENFVLRLTLYIDLVEDGADYPGALEKAFGISMDELARKVSEHGQTCCARYKVDLNTLEEDFDPRVSEIDRESISAALEAISTSMRQAHADEEQ